MYTVYIHNDLQLAYQDTPRILITEVESALAQWRCYGHDAAYTAFLHEFAVAILPCTSTLSWRSVPSVQSYHHCLCSATVRYAGFCSIYRLLSR